MLHPRGGLAPLASALLSSACATVSVPASAPPQSLGVATQHWVDAASPGAPILGWGTAPLPGNEIAALAGARCTASNDRGSWTVVTPGVLQVLRSSAPLVVICRHEGYRDERIEMRCVHPNARTAAAAVWIASGTGIAAVVALPVAAVAGVLATSTADICVYGGRGDARLEIVMTRNR